MGWRKGRALRPVGVVAALCTVVFLAASSVARASQPVTTTFTPSSTGQFTVPAGITSLQISLRGASGGAGGPGASSGVGGGPGTQITGTLPVTPGQVLGVEAGEGGGDGSASDSENCNSTDGGQAGVDSELAGGDGGAGTGCDGGGGGAGGAASFLSFPAGTALVIAGGGGGGGGAGLGSGGDGGPGGSGTSGGGDGAGAQGSGGARGGQLGFPGGRGSDACPSCDSGGGGGGGGGENGGDPGGVGSGAGGDGGGGGGAGTDFVTPSLINPGISTSSAGSGADGLITITYTPADATQTSVSCSPAPVIVGRPATCTATVTDTETVSPSPPTGTVTFESSGAGVFGGSPCTLQGSGVTVRCSVTYTPTAGNTGPHTITARYNGGEEGQGSGAHIASSGTAPLSVNLRDTSSSAKCLPVYVPLEQPATCTVTFTDSGAGAATTPSGTVSFRLVPLSSKMKGTFSDGGQCTLQGTGASAACSVSYTPTVVGGLHEIIGTYRGDGAHLGAQGVSFVIATAAVGASPPRRCAGQPATLPGSGRADQLAGTRRADVILGAAENDRISARGGNDLVCAGDGSDRVQAGSGDDRVFGQGGNDLLSGGGGRDALLGGTGNDHLDGGTGNDQLLGGPGNDRINPGPGRDRVSAGAGADHVDSRDGQPDVIDCGPGHDVAIVDATDRARRCEVVIRPHTLHHQTARPTRQG
jgi:hypothetical protein